MSKIMKKICIVLILFVAVLSIHGIANATEPVKTEETGKSFKQMGNGLFMPLNSVGGTTGMFPQNFMESAGRSVYISDTRFLPQTKSWKAAMEGSMVYCSDYHSYVRFAVRETDRKYFYIKNSDYKTLIQKIEIDNLEGAGYRTVADHIENMKNIIFGRIKKYIGSTYYTNPSVNYDNPGSSETAEPYTEDDIKSKIKIKIGELDVDKWIEQNPQLAQAIAAANYGELLAKDDEKADASAERYMEMIMQKVYDKLSEDGNSKRFLKEDTSDKTTDSQETETFQSDAVKGPKVIVMENGEEQGYKAGEKYSFANEKLSFIFSACEDAYDKGGNYANKYSIYDIQTAYWQYLKRDNSAGIKDPSGSREEPSGNITDTDLYDKAVEYEKFVTEIAESPKKEFGDKEYLAKTKLHDEEAQVIVDRDKKQYILGPYSVEYPYYQDISYIKSINITDISGTNKLVYDEKNDKIKIILDGEGVKNSNGLTKVFPNSKQKFFVIFNAEDLGYPTDVKLDVQFEYLKETKVHEATLYTTNANTYQYMGHCLTEGEYQAHTIEVKWRYSFPIKSPEEEPTLHKENCEYAEGKTDRPCACPKGYFNVDIADPAEADKWNTVTIYVPYLLLEDAEQEADAQETLVVQEISKVSIEGGSEEANGELEGNAQRIYQRVSLIKEIDLTIELGGYVFLDNNGGKESKPDGKYSNEAGERKVSNIDVTLYQEDGTEIGRMKTGSEGNAEGHYLFTRLNAMFQYYVKFTYNGQYYQATTFSSSETWGGTDWKNNSNAKDIRKNRENYNARFAIIGSSPENYKVLEENRTNETFTKMELLGYTLQKDGTYKLTNDPIIDSYLDCQLKEEHTNGNHTPGCYKTFGTLIKSSSNDEREQKMIQYVKDCMIDAYTTADGAEGLYPTPSLFVIDEKPVTRDYVRLIGGIPEILYDNAYYINLGLNPREQTDIAIKKDIEKVTLEINGQKQDYTYDTLENKENADEQWDIHVRLSDAYYNTNYSRELYKSDYIYKASMYGDADANGDGIGDTYGKSKKDELEVYITYKIIVSNNSLSIRTKIDEVVDYYDEDLEYIDERSYIEIRARRNQEIPDAAQSGKYPVYANKTSQYSPNTMTSINGYDKLYVTGLGKLNADENSKENYLAAGQKAYIYLTFKVKKDNIDNEDWVRLDENIETAVAQGVGKENIVEINGYTTQYPDGAEVPNVGKVSFKPAGIIDIDSNPGNLKAEYVPKDGEIQYEKFEDDTDKAPNLRLILHRDDDATRVIAGTVWEDERNEEIEATATGNGIREEKETLINGVTVQLVELIGNPNAEKKEYVWREFGAPARNLGEVGGYGENNTVGQGQGSGLVKEETPIINYKNLVSNYTFEENHNGQYAFKSFMPGKFVIRFIYGDTIKTVVPNSLGGVNEKSYNGQDYKTTTYQEGITQNKTYEWREPSSWNLGQEILGQIITQVQTFKPDASNNETAYVSKRENQDGYLYDITASDAKADVSDAKDIFSRREQVINYSNTNVTNYIAEVLASHKNDYETMNDRNTLVNDLIQNTKMTAETGLMVIELEYDRTGTLGQVNNNKATYKVQNVDLGLEERPKAELATDKKVTNVKVILANGSILFDAKETAANVLWKKHKTYEVGYVGNVLDKSKFGSIQNIRDKNANKIGLIQLSMDEELMHGATIEITYQITVTNVGEVDYKDNLFYYTGNKSANAQIVTTTPNQVIDYVANNLQFDASKNSNWNVIERATIDNEGLVNAKLKEQLDKYNTIIESKGLNVELVPTLYKQKVDGTKANEVSVPLVLTQLITAENDSDDLTYRNIVEIVKTSNTVGRRMEYSVVGNQDPTQDPQEIDSDKAEVVRILPPFGNAGMHIIIPMVAVIVLVILTGGIIFIKKKILK